MRILPTLAAVMPLPRLLVTPPVTKTYFAMGRGSSGVFLMLSNPGPGRESESGWSQLEDGMEFADVVMNRRAVRRFEDGGVDREVIERIARLAQRTPSAGFSQGQRLVVVTDPDRRREVARICGEEEYADFGPWVSECAAQFIPCVSEAIYHRRYQEPDKVDEDGREIDWPVPYWWVDIGATMQNIMLAAVDEGLGCGFIGPDIERPPRLPRRSPTSSCRSGSCRVGRPLPDIRSPSLKRGWVPFEQFARWEGWA